ncbi:MAG: threonine dehydratase [Alphaproteobacteria bacterium]|jgi:threonine dehydratase|nr:threonine dehydratase [Alphaproteobacteria bacterium]MDP6515081.1 threonine dehydratase [Alphaproteobacteria bacterium]
MKLTLDQLNEAAAKVHAVLPTTPQYAWPLLAQRAGCEVWVKHENHTPTGAFKVRGGVLYMIALKARAPDCPGVIAATRGNHGQSVAVAAQRLGLSALIVVPEGNNPEKNRAMAAQGAELVVHGADFQIALEHAEVLAAARGLHMVPPFDATLVSGVASYALEMFAEIGEPDAAYVPIGLGSGICGVIAVRDALGLKTAVIGVQAEGAPSYALSFAAGNPVSTNAAATFADGLATRTPVPEAVAIVNRGAERVVTVSDRQILEAQAILLRDTHNLAEPAGAAPLAALLAERERMRGKRVALILSGGNADAANLRALAAMEPDET